MNVEVRDSSQSHIAGPWAVSSKAAISSGGEHFILQLVRSFVSCLHTQPSHALFWLSEPSDAPVLKCISLLFSPEMNLSCHCTSGYALSFFFCSVTLCKCWCITELSQEQISKIIVSDGVFTSCNCQCLAQIFKLARETSLHHRKALIFECVVGLSVNCPSFLTLKVPLLPNPTSQFGGSLCIAIMSNLEYELNLWKMEKKPQKASKQASPYLLPTVLLDGSNSHSGMELRTWFRCGTGWAQDAWWGSCWFLSIHSCSWKLG